MALPSFADVAAEADPALDTMALALAAEFREIDPEAALGQLDALGEELAAALAGSPTGPEAEARVCAAVLGDRHGFRGDDQQYDRPENSMLDLVLERRRGLPILLSVVYVAVGRRAGLPLAGVGLPGHYVAGHFGAVPPVLLDPFGGGALVTPAPGHEDAVRPWTAHETALRMLNNLVAAFQRRGDLARALHAAELRMTLPAQEGLRETLHAELLALKSRLN